MTHNQTLNCETTPPPEGPEYLGADSVSNTNRAESALAGVLGFIDGCETDDCDAVADFLCNLRHLLDRMPATYGTWGENLARADVNYRAEITPSRAA